jgi:hypothetical protein
MTRTHATGVATAALLSVVAVLAVVPAVTAGTSSPRITGIDLTGDSGDPTVTLDGSGFGRRPPRSFPAGHTSCGNYENNGRWYGRNGLWFLDVTRDWQAGSGTRRGGGNCIGIIVVSWTPTRVVYKFGSAYGSFGTWTAEQGDDVVVSLRGVQATGTVDY